MKVINCLCGQFGKYRKEQTKHENHLPSHNTDIVTADVLPYYLTSQSGVWHMGHFI